MAETRSRYAHGRSEIHERKTLVRRIASERDRLGKRLRELRTARKMTQAEAAEAVGIHTVHVARIEKGGVNVTISTLVAFAVAYDVPLNSLFEASAMSTHAEVAEEEAKSYRPTKRKKRGP